MNGPQESLRNFFHQVIDTLDTALSLQQSAYK